MSEPQENDFSKIALKFPQLTGSDRRALRAAGHHLNPMVMVGRLGVTDAVIEATDEALQAHELIKVSISGDAPDSRKDAPQILAEATGSLVVQIIGRTCLLYRPRREEDPENKEETGGENG